MILYYLTQFLTLKLTLNFLFFFKQCAQRVFVHNHHIQHIRVARTHGAGRVLPSHQGHTEAFRSGAEVLRRQISHFPIVLAR